MAKMRLTAELQAKTEIAPELRTQIAATLSTFLDLKTQADVLDEAMEAEKAKVFAMLEAGGYESLEVDGVPCTIVRGTSSKLDKQKFVSLGGSLSQLTNATVSKPKKAYLRIGAEKAHEAT